MLIAQHDDVSCGPACAATVSAICGAGLDYEFWRKALQPGEGEGCDNDDFAACLAARLPCASCGENTYEGGVAIANIIHDSGDGHYVVFLAEKDGAVIYYDPYDDALVETPLADINWRSGWTGLKNWALNIDAGAGDFDTWRDFAATRAKARRPAGPPVRKRTRR